VQVFLNSSNFRIDSWSPIRVAVQIRIGRLDVGVTEQFLHVVKRHPAFDPRDPALFCR
jgi:hypothetical protein